MSEEIPYYSKLNSNRFSLHGSPPIFLLPNQPLKWMSPTVHATTPSHAANWGRCSEHHKRTPAWQGQRRGRKQGRCSEHHGRTPMWQDGEGGGGLWRHPPTSVRPSWCAGSLASCRSASAPASCPPSVR